MKTPAPKIVPNPQPVVRLTPQGIADNLQAVAGAGFLNARCTEWAEGTQGRKSHQVWLTITRDALLPCVQGIIHIHYPHFAVIASADVGPAVELTYHFYVYWGIPGEDILITLGDQYHLIRLVPNNLGLFLYLVLDKAKGNLALARYKLTDIERSLKV